MKHKKQKTSITEPKFHKIFLVRFLIMLAFFSLVSVYAFYRLDSMVYDSFAEDISAYKNNIISLAQNLSSSEPDSDEYRDAVCALESEIAIYQSYRCIYTQVTIGNLVISSDEDTAFMSRTWKNESDGRYTTDKYYIEDMSYLAPLTSYMDGKLDPRKMTEMYLRLEKDPAIEILEGMGMDHFGKLDFYSYSDLLTAYVNGEEHSFIPGIIRVTYLGETYEIDCTPSDTKGYEKVIFSDEFEPDEVSRWFAILYRVAPELSDKDLYDVYVPDRNGEPYCWDINEYEDKLEDPRLKDKAWMAAFSIPEYVRPFAVFEYAPVSSSLIIVTALVAAVVISFILATVKYQKDKTVWKIYDYRIKTTEAMAHDLKTPLSAILAYAESIADTSSDPVKVREYSLNICEKVSDMTRMVDDILMLSRSSSEGSVITKEEVSVMETIKQCALAFPDMDAKIHGIDKKLMTDKKLFKQAIDNLLSNCNRYGQKDAPVDIQITEDCLTITNKTPMTYDDTESLKKPFVKGEDSRNGKGTGLGLAIADNNIAALGYKLNLVSEEGIFKAVVRFR